MPLLVYEKPPSAFCRRWFDKSRDIFKVFQLVDDLIVAFTDAGVGIVIQIMLVGVNGHDDGIVAGESHDHENGGFVFLRNAAHLRSLESGL